MKITIFHTQYADLKCNARTWALLVCMTAITVVVLALRLFYGHTYPIPWTDETDFLAQAFALYKHGTLFVSALNESRDVMWMPPGYMVVMAGIFKIFGYSLDVTRWFSATCYLISYALLLRLIAQQFQGWRFAATLLLSLAVFASPWTFSVANMARMEALYTLLFMLALSALIARRIVLGLALILIAGVVHFNAVYFLYPLALFALCHLFSKKRPIIKRHEWFFLAFALLIDFAYLAYITSHWRDFVFDMSMQFRFKNMGPFMGGIGGMALALICAAPGLTLFWREKYPYPSTIFFAFGAAFIIMALAGQTMNYDYARALGAQLIFMGTIFWVTPIRLTLILPSAAALLTLYFIITPQPQFAAMLPRLKNFNRDYLIQGEAARIRHFIHSLPEGSTVSFGHTGIETTFISDMDTQKVHWVLPYYSVTQPLPFRHYDYAIRCTSSLTPHYLLLYRQGWVSKSRFRHDLPCVIDPTDKTS